MFKKIMFKKIRGYELEFLENGNVTFDGKTRPARDWLLENWDTTIDGYKQVFTAILEHLLATQGKEFWIHHTRDDGKEDFKKAYAESEKCLWGDAGDFTDNGNYDRHSYSKTYWHRVPTPWWTVECPECGVKANISMGGNEIGFYESGKCNKNCKTVWLVGGNTLTVTSGSRTWSCELKEGDWNPKLLEVKKARLLPVVRCSQCLCIQSSENKICAECDAIFEEVSK